MIHTLDILFTIVPRIENEKGYTSAGPALLKGSLNKAGFSSRIIDFNDDLKYVYRNDPETLSMINRFYNDFTYYNKDIYNILESFYDRWARDITVISPKWLGVQVFSFDSYRSARLLALKVKELNPKQKIVFGGAGIGGVWNETGGPEYAERMKTLGIIDAYIVGEAELSLVELLKENVDYFGINKREVSQFHDLSKLEYPDYDDYWNSLYGQDGLTALPITGSRGGVRKCTFCDVHKLWEKFVFRDGDDIAQEMINGVNRYGVTKFKFTDSLINGSRIAFEKLIKKLAIFRMNLPEKKRFKFDAQYIIRGKKYMPPEFFDQMRDAGVGVLYIGIESGSPAVRNHMRKGFDENDLEYSMEQFRRCGIQVKMLLMAGYITETEEDFNQTLDMVTRYKKYLDEKIIHSVELGLTLMIYPGTPLYDDREKYNVLHNEKHISGWVCKDNPSLTYKERIRRRIILHEHLEKLGYKISRLEILAKQMLMKWREYEELNPEDINLISIDDINYDASSHTYQVNNENSNQSTFKITHQ